MASESTAASSSLLRSRTALFLLSAFAATTALYYYSSRHLDAATSSTEAGALHRSNAIHRRRRRTAVNNENASPTIPASNAENDEDAEIVARNLTDGETLADDSAYQDNFDRQESPSSSDRTGQNTVQLLFRVSEDAMTRNSYVHRGCLCNSCGVVPIRGIRYRCANCADFDLCEGCEAQGCHTRTHVFFKIRVPVIPMGAGQMQPVWYTGDPDTKMRALPKELVSRLTRETGLDRPDLEASWEQWTFMANTEWRDDPDDLNLAMDRKTFERCLLPVGMHKHAPPSLIFERMFAFYDTNKDDLIGFSEFVHALGYRKKKNKWRRIFDGYDIDEDGFVDRKDFLRIFRSYYVLHKQMQRDMLHGLQEQQMASTDAHTLVNGRQPLSSAFGTDGMIPPAAEPRRGEGKMRRSNGDLEIADGKGIINESGADTGDREDVFRRHLPRRRSWIPWRDGSSASNHSEFWDAILNPPSTMDQVPDLLNTLTRARQEVLEDMEDHEDVNSEPIANDIPQAVDPDHDHFNDFGSTNERWPPGDVAITEEDVRAVLGSSTSVADVRPEHRQAVSTYATDRAQARDALHERWKRRQFYTDEEEGASPPDDWEEEEDILAQNGMVADVAKGSRPSFHSRSSSKVRFAEDMDDLDTRSNPSTSSRSVPERWGGMEIPDAEKDAGKEILYQVTQQAFNDLLDSLFKEKEGLAVEAAGEKTRREKYRHLFNRPGFMKWATEKEIEEKTNIKIVYSNTPEIQMSNAPEPQEVEIEYLRQRPLGNLLASTGYTVEEPDDDYNSADEAIPESAPSPPPAAYLEENRRNRTASENGDDAEAESQQTTYLHPSSSTHASDHYSFTSLPSYQDPTLPQFRPNSTSTLWSHRPSHRRSPSPSPYSSNDVSPSSNNRDSAYNAASPSNQSAYHASSQHSPGRTSRYPPKSHNQPSSPPSPTKYPAAAEEEAEKDEEEDDEEEEEEEAEAEAEYLSNANLYTLWKCDKAAQEAEERGGWGKLDFKEFETVVKRHAIEGKPGNNQLDYLGSWIDFCIP